MAPTNEFDFEGVKGRVRAYRWDAESPRYVAVLAHGYAEHAGRYEHVAQALLDAGAAAVYVAGRPKAALADLAAIGVERTIHVGADVRATLAELLGLLEVP